MTSALLFLKIEFFSGVFGLIPNFLIKRKMLKTISHFLKIVANSSFCFVQL